MECWCKLIFASILLTAEMSSIPLDQFFLFGVSARDERLNLGDDSSSPPIAVSPPFTILGRERNSMHVNSNGVISFQFPFTSYSPRPFPFLEETLLCPFWDDINPLRGGDIYHNNVAYHQETVFKASRLIQEVLGYAFHPTTVFTATWDHVLPYDIYGVPTNTFQCALATDGQDTFLFFLYAENLIEWTSHNAQVGMDGGDGVNYYSIPNSLTPEIVNITHTSNVNTPGLWILKVDKHIIAGLPSVPSDLLIINAGATEVTLGWIHNSSNAAENFLINCIRFAQTAANAISIMIADPRPTILEDPKSGSTTRSENFSIFAYQITGLQEHTSYTCSITARNIFGWSPSSETIEIMRNSSDISEGALNIGVIGGVGGTAVLLLASTIATVAAVCIIMVHKRKKEADFHAGNAVSIEVNICDKVDQQQNLALKSQTVPATKQKAHPAKHYMVDSEHHYKPREANLLNVPHTQHTPGVKNQGTKKPMMPPKPPSASEQGCSSDSVYTSLNPASMGNSQWSQEQYMTPRKGAAQELPSM